MEIFTGFIYVVVIDVFVPIAMLSHLFWGRPSSELLELHALQSFWLKENT
jgi:hypothetical protein